DSILRHARERKQSLCGGDGNQRVSTNLRGDVGPAWRATTIRRNRYCRYLRRGFGRGGILSAYGANLRAASRSALVRNRWILHPHPIERERGKFLPIRKLRHDRNGGHPQNRERLCPVRRLHLREYPIPLGWQLQTFSWHWQTKAAG